MRQEKKIHRLNNWMNLHLKSSMSLKYKNSQFKMRIKKMEMKTLKKSNQ